jgi:hypothetical protein
MKSQALAATSSPLLALAIIAMFLFMAVFIAAAVKAARTKPKEIEELSRLPFDGREESRHG